MGSQTDTGILPRGYHEGISSFPASLNYYKTNDVWVAFATRNSIKSADFKLNLTGDIEMAVPVMTNKDIPFYTPMGIFRAVEFYESKKHRSKFSVHKNLSMDLHSFVAQAIKAVYGNKDYLITKPVPTMLKIMEKNLSSKTMWIGTPSYREKEKKELEKDFNEVTTALKAISDYEHKKIELLELEKIYSSIDFYFPQNNIQENLAVQKKNLTKELSSFPLEKLNMDITTPLLEEDFSKNSITLTNRLGKNVSLEMPEFYHHEHMYPGAKTVIVDIDALAKFMKLDE